MSRPRFVDCQGLAGAWSLGTAQAGFDLAHRASLPGGFGDAVMEENRFKFRGLKGPWSQEVGTPGDGWTPQEGVSFLCGTPPCSGFSLMNRSKKENARGPDSNINLCMRELITYAGECTGSDGRPGPEIVSFESVQGAYSQGRGLMVTFLNLLNDLTRARYKSGYRDGFPQQYVLTHVLMSGSSVGAAQMRHRYFPVFHRIPFGVTNPKERQIETYASAIGDLLGLKEQWEDQHVKLQPRTEFQRIRRREDGKVDCMIGVESGRIWKVLEQYGDGWEPGDNLAATLERRGIRPPEIEGSWHEDEGKYGGWSWPVRIRPDRPGYVLTGGAIFGCVHWKENRFLNVRECSRLMGYPDFWTWPTTHAGQASALIGKCCPVNSGQWLSEFALAAVKGRPPKEPDVEQIAEGEYLHNSTLLYKRGGWPGSEVLRSKR